MARLEVTEFVLSKVINWNGDLEQADPFHAIILWCCPCLVPVSEMSSHYRCHYLLSVPLCYILLCYCPCIVHVSEMSSHYQYRYLMLDPLCAVVLCYRPFTVPVSEMSYHYQCCYLLFHPLRAILPFTISQTTQIKLKTVGNLPGGYVRGRLLPLFPLIRSPAAGTV